MTITDDENKIIFAENLNYQMQRCGKSRSDLCCVLDIKYTTLRDWLHALTYPRIKSIQALADYFNIPKHELTEKQFNRSASEFNVDCDPTTIHREIFSDNLKHYMALNKISRNVICDDLKIPYTTFSDWVNAKKFPRIEQIQLLADYFGILKSHLIEKRLPSENSTVENIGRIGSLYLADRLPVHQFFTINNDTSIASARIEGGEQLYCRQTQFCNLKDNDLIVSTDSSNQLILSRFNRIDQDKFVLSSDARFNLHSIGDVTILGVVYQVIISL
jgi:transcriptional regulator with XRE-family HTH domain